MHLGSILMFTLFNRACPVVLDHSKTMGMFKVYASKSLDSEKMDQAILNLDGFNGF